MRWVLPGKACIPAACFLLWCRFCTLWPDEIRLFRFFADGEMREMAMAWFFLWYVAGLRGKITAFTPSDTAPSPFRTARARPSVFGHKI